MLMGFADAVLSASVTKSVAMRPLVPTALHDHDHYRQLNATLNALSNDNNCVFLTVSRLCLDLLVWRVHSS